MTLRVFASVVLVSIALSGVAHAQDVRTRYVGTSFRAFAGAAPEGENLLAVGQDLFVGYRFARWFSLEGFYAFNFQNGRAELGGSGNDFCPPNPAATWKGNSYRWETLGVRPWFHVAHTRFLDVSIAPVVAGGFVFNHTSFCSSGNVVTKSAALEAGVDAALELRPTRWLGIRIAVDTVLAIPFTVVGLSARVGPLLRF